MDVAADSPTRLLIVDDDVKLCRLIANYLAPLGYEVSAVHTGREGLQRAMHERFAAVILDVMLPGLNGFDVLRELRRHSQVPVLMLTALGDEPDRIVGLELGADDYLRKTFSTRALSNVVRNAVRYAGAAGPIEISSARENGMAVLRVSDCGPGLSGQDLDAVFEPFYRPEPARERLTGGVGLGLAIVRSCIESCQGTVRCRNRTPSGLEVEIRLQLGKGLAPDIAAGDGSHAARER